MSMERRRNRFRDSTSNLVDDKLDKKRRKIVDEFYETEKAYVDGLELIYSVRRNSLFASRHLISL